MTRPDGRPKCERPNCGGVVKARGLCQKHYNLDRRANPPVPVGVVAQHIALLTEAGLSYRSIAALAGVGVSTVDSAATRRSEYLFPDSAAKILAVTPPVSLVAVDPYDKARAPILGSARRLQALVAMGHTNEQLVEQLERDGGSEVRIEEVLGQRHPFVWVRTARRIDALYQRLKDVVPPDSYGGRRARKRAERRGWLPPNAWEDIDDPLEDPMLGAGRRVSAAERIREVRELGVTGVEAIAERLGIKPESVKRELARIEERERRAAEWERAWDEAHAEQAQREQATWPYELAAAS